MHSWFAYPLTMVAQIGPQRAPGVFGRREPAVSGPCPLDVQGLESLVHISRTATIRAHSTSCVPSRCTPWAYLDLVTIARCGDDLPSLPCDNLPCQWYRKKRHFVVITPRPTPSSLLLRNASSSRRSMESNGWINLSPCVASCLKIFLHVSLDGLPDAWKSEDA